MGTACFVVPTHLCTSARRFLQMFCSRLLPGVPLLGRASLVPDHVCRVEPKKGRER